MEDVTAGSLGERDTPSWLQGQNKAKAAEIAGHFAQIMQVLGLDLSDPHLRGTPDRVGRMYMEIFRELDDQGEPEITCFPNSDGYDNMVIVKDIEFFSVLFPPHNPVFWQGAHSLHTWGRDRRLEQNRAHRRILRPPAPAPRASHPANCGLPRSQIGTQRIHRRNGGPAFVHGDAGGGKARGGDDHFGAPGPFYRANSARGIF